MPESTPESTPESLSPSVPHPSASCPECGGDCVPATVSLLVGGHPGVLYIERPGALWPCSSTLRTLACTQCGLTRLYAEKPADLLPKK